MLKVDPVQRGVVELSDRYHGGERMVWNCLRGGALLGRDRYRKGGSIGDFGDRVDGEGEEVPTTVEEDGLADW